MMHRCRMLSFLRCMTCLSICGVVPLMAQSSDSMPKVTHSFSQPFIDAAKKAQPSVVSIKSRMKKGSSQSWQRDDDQDEISPDEFWERFFGMPSPDRHSRQPKSHIAYGSGFIVSPDGYVLTNNHVVEKADDITVTTTEGKEYRAKKIGTDPSTDIAILKIDAQNLLPLCLADSSLVEVGEWVLAVGNPFGLQASVTSGIISAKGRSDLDIVRVEQFFQTDAAINMGNSGGPLVNLHGDVIGMNTAIASNTGGHMGIGFAIPSNLLKDVMKELIEHGHLSRGYLGVALQRVDADIAAAVGLCKPQGALVSEVLPGGAAESAGLQSGDVILELNGIPIESLGSFRGDITLSKPGQKVTMKVRRNTQDIMITATISENREAEGQGGVIADTYGLMLEPITAELAKKYNLEAKTGLLIVQIDPESSSYQAGLRAGYVVLAVNGTAVASVDEFAQAVQKSEAGGRLLLQIKVGQSIRFVPLTVE